MTLNANQMFKRLLWTPMLSQSKNGLQLARLYQALCYYSSVFYEECIEDALSSKWFEIADDVYDKLSLIDKGFISDVDERYFNEIRHYLLEVISDSYRLKSISTNATGTEDFIPSIIELREHIYDVLHGTAKNEMPVYVK